MMITKDTKLADLLQEYPWLKSEVMQISDKFKMLNTPVGKIMLKKATVAEMSKKSGIERIDYIWSQRPLRLFKACECTDAD